MPSGLLISKHWCFLRLDYVDVVVGFDRNNLHLRRSEVNSCWCFFRWMDCVYLLKNWIVFGVICLTV